MNDAGWEFRPEAITAADWRQIVQSATDTAIITTNQAGLVTSWNQGAFRLLGWTEEKMLGQTLARLFEDSRRLSFLVRGGLIGKLRWLLRPYLNDWQVRACRASTRS
ncbi:MULTISPECIES: PAS domain-containing protein [unclassified Bradyrhizobium]|uniref:PAS domain-containing protein n=1 Tax=unclassified Bradyrhizobium TaxID=2631580 RepID=UPI001BACA9CC|nr:MULTISPECIES: PAS domain-containing protein [unclassified Bradyrhizobium]MBR1208783.1 PAS domain-containing protein [Bradyrhizobium sp. AUGA SZCCT0124]MBR1316976.1 PAS domain-containing protein [Bradyrhizobium sp. AUGA SZCCT0051]MBR1345228.1 PAS domain-containing protein [Bradyrhizobium sp. AUGA SZCCT0105]MBR1360070.1 PAS domain-containing protein [Bradyrhizobium sp. AUGA SZCCT0045]